MGRGGQAVHRLRGRHRRQRARHGAPRVVRAVSDQIATLGHVSNLFIAEPPVALAEKLLELAGRPGRVYFCNSGAEAVEAAFKIGRLTGRTHMVATEGGFHGRTMGALALTGQPGKQEPFRPLPGDVTHVPYGDAEALRAAVTEETALVLLEPVQGENGVVVPPEGYLAAAREITPPPAPCSSGRDPDRRRPHRPLVRLPGRGRRAGRHHARQGPRRRAAAWGPPSPSALPPNCSPPGSTAPPSAATRSSCAAGLAVLETIAADGLLDHVKRVGGQLRDGILGLGHPMIGQVRGAGLLLGIVLTEPVAPLAQQTAQDAGFLVNAVAPDVLRLAPPLIVGEEEVEALVRALPAVLDAAAERQR